MYPTISHLIADIFGVYIPLPIQTFGFWVAIAFFTARYLLTKELERKEKEGLLKSVLINKKIGEKMKINEIIISIISYFIIGFKLVEAIFNYEDLVINPQEFILSSRGHFFGGIIFSLFFTFLKWKEKNKNKLEKPKIVEQEIHPYQLVGNITMIACSFIHFWNNWSKSIPPP